MVVEQNIFCSVISSLFTAETLRTIERDYHSAIWIVLGVLIMSYNVLCIIAFCKMFIHVHSQIMFLFLADGCRLLRQKGWRILRDKRQRQRKKAQPVQGTGSQILTISQAAPLS